MPHRCLPILLVISSLVIIAIVPGVTGAQLANPSLPRPVLLPPTQPQPKLQLQPKLQPQPKPKPQPKLGADFNPVRTLELLVGNLYNGLVKEGALKAPLLEKPEQVWQRDFVVFRAAFQTYIDSYPSEPAGGAFLTPLKLYHSGYLPAVSYSGIEFLLSIGNETLSLGPQRGITPVCQTKPVKAGTPELVHVIAGNVQCLYVQFLNNYARQQNPGQPPLVTWETVEESGVVAYLTAYLEQQKAAGLVKTFQINTDSDYVEIELMPNLPPPAQTRTMLALYMANFLTPTEEATLTEQNIRFVLAEDDFRYLLHLPANWQQYPTGILFADLFRSLDAVVKLGPKATPQAKKQAFMREYGYSSESQSLAERPASPFSFKSLATRLLSLLAQVSGLNLGTPPPTPPTTQPSDDCALTFSPYPDGLVTPANKCVGYLVTRGAWWWKGAMDILASRLEDYGYGVERIPFDSGGNSIPREEFNFTARKLGRWFKKAQTLLVDGHGAPDGSNHLACIPVEYGTSACCQAVSQLAVAFGLEALDCKQPEPPMSHPSGSVRAKSSGKDTCERVSSEFGNLCLIDARLDLLLAGKGEKAVYVTVQCYGGICPGGGSGVMDYVSAPSTEPSSMGISQLDLGLLLSNDLVGLNQKYLRCQTSPPDPVTGPFCVSDTPADEVRGFNWQRVIQESFHIRGTTFSDYFYTMPCSPLFEGRKYFNAQGDRQYCLTTVSGKPETRVEFAPSVRDVLWGGLGGGFTAEFTSQVKPSGQINVDFGACQPRLAGKPNYLPGQEPKITAADATFTLDNSNFNLMDRTEWQENPKTLRYKYGKAPVDGWPWYIRVTIRDVKAPNGVALDGNDTAPNKWIWPYPGGPTINVPPWSNLRGVAPNDDPFIVKLPCKPPIVCGKPVITGNPDPDDEEKCAVLNGYSAQSTPSIGTHPANPLADCYVQVEPTDTCKKKLLFKGITKLWREPCTGDPDVPNEEEGAICDAYKVVRKCPKPPDPCRRDKDTHALAYQYRQWPLDRSSDEQLPLVVGACDCPI